LGAEVVGVSLDLAEMYARIRRSRRAIDILNDVIPLAEALDLRQDVLIARLLREQVLRQ
jgi:hypothetical protein